MGKVTGFMEIRKKDRKYLDIDSRITNYNEFVVPLTDETKDQAARCMDCGVPYCHSGCPVNNQIPDWNDLVYSDNGKKLLIIYILQIIFQNLQEEYVLLLVKHHVL